MEKVEQDQEQLFEKIKKIIKNPLNSFREDTIRETKLLTEFLEFIGWVREHLTRKIELKKLLSSLDAQMQTGLDILKIAFGNIFFNSLQFTLKIFTTNFINFLFLLHPLTPGVQDLTKQNLFQKTSQLDKPAILTDLEVTHINKMLQLNKHLFLTKGEITRKSENSFIYLKKVLEKKASWTRNQDADMVQKLQNLMFVESQIFSVLEKIEKEVLGKLMGRFPEGGQKGQEVEDSFLLLVHAEFCFFKLLDRNMDLKNLMNRRRALSSRKSGACEYLYIALQT